MQELSKAVIDLEAYRQLRPPCNTQSDVVRQQQDQEVIEEIAHHLLIVIRALRRLSH